MCGDIFLWHLDDIFHGAFACKGNGWWHGLLRGIIFLKEPCICKMRFSPGEWFNAIIYLPFPALIVFQTLMESGGENPVLIEPWPSEQQFIRGLGINYIEDGGR